MTWRTWQRQGPSLWEPALDTGVVAGAATALALALTLACLEAEHRFGVRVSIRALWLLYLPLLVPQIAFLVGLQTLALGTGLDEGRGVVVAAHLVFVLPYVFLSLADPFRAWDTRYATVAGALGAGPNRVFWTVRLPMLLRPVLTAAAVGFAVSVGQYLPTLLVGAGRIQTLTTEAVALASGGDRRVIGVYGLAQTAAAFVPFFFAVVIPGWCGATAGPSARREDRSMTDDPTEEGLRLDHLSITLDGVRLVDVDDHVAPVRSSPSWDRRARASPPCSPSSWGPSHPPSR